MDSNAPDTKAGTRAGECRQSIHTVMDPVRVFVGSSPKHEVPERVLIHSVVSQSSRPVEINVIDAVAEEIRCTDATGASRLLPLPPAWQGRMYIRGTGFHYARFAPPQLSGYQGRAIYLESDQLLLGDIAELWEFPLAGASCAAVPALDVRGPVNVLQQGGYISSVLVYDCARSTGLDALQLCEGTATPGRDSAQFSMSDDFLQQNGLTVTALPPQWNDHERRNPDTKLLHFSNQRQWPVDTPFHPESRTWINAYLAAVDAGFINNKLLDRALQMKTISRRVRTLARLPRWAVPTVDLTWQLGEYCYRQTRKAAARVLRLLGLR